MSQTPNTDAEKQAVVETAAKAGAQDGNDGVKADDALKFVNAVLKREFSSLEDAAKTLENLNSMVGDNAIAELREKAKEAEHFDTVVKAYAKEEGLSYGEARKSLLENVKSSPTVETKPTQETSVDPKLREEFEAIKSKLQEKELIESYPEAKAVLNELKAMAKAMPDKELRQIYEGSALKDTLIKAVEYEKKTKEAPSSTVSSNPRQYNFESDNLKKAIEDLKVNNFEGNQIKFVEEALKQLGG